MRETNWNRRSVVLLAAAVAIVPVAGLAESETLYVAKSPTCGCCGAWVDHMRQAGFDVKIQNFEYGALQKLKGQLGIAPRHASCHTAQIGGYVIEGHVPATEVRRILTERPHALGLAVPGMPVGSPGMEMGDQQDPYDVVLIKNNGQEEVFHAYR